MGKLYFENDEREDLAVALIDKGYDVSFEDGGDWGAHTDVTIRRWRTPHPRLLGIVLPIVLAIVALKLAVGLALGTIVVLACGALFCWYGLPAFQASFTREYDAREEQVRVSSTDVEELRPLVPIIERTTTRKVIC